VSDENVSADGKLLLLLTRTTGLFVSIAKSLGKNILRQLTEHAVSLGEEKKRSLYH